MMVDQLGTNPVPIQLPIGKASSFKGALEEGDGSGPTVYDRWVRSNSSLRNKGCLWVQGMNDLGKCKLDLEKLSFSGSNSLAESSQRFGGILGSSPSASHGRIRVLCAGSVFV